MGQIKHYNQSIIDLTAGVILEHSLSQSSNLVYVRNPSAAARILFGDDNGITVTRYQVYADIDGAGAFVRPYKFNKIYLLSSAGINRVTIEEYEVEDPAIFIIQAAKGVAADVNILSSVLPVGAATQATLATRATEATLALVLAKLAAIDLEGVNAVKVTVAGAGDEVVKATPGKVYAVRAAAGVNLILKDNITEKWNIPAASKDEFSQPIAHLTNITLNFDAAGDAWIIYQ
jgi:hypothetical protein